MFTSNNNNNDKKKWFINLKVYRKPYQKKSSGREKVGLEEMRIDAALELRD